MLKIFYTMLYIINWEYKYIINDQIKLKKNEYFIFKVDPKNVNESIKITFKIKLMESNNILIINNGINIFYITKINPWICTQIYEINKKTNKKIICKDLNNNEYYIDNNNPNYNYNYNYIKFTSRNTNENNIILEDIVISYKDNIDYDDYYFNINDENNFYPLTYLLIDFFNNQPGSKYLYNEIKNLYTWNLVGHDSNNRDFNQLFSDYDNQNIPNWYTINNIGSFTVNPLLINVLNNMMIKNFCIGFNMEIFIKPQNNEYNFLTIFKNDTEKLSSKIILAQKNYLSNLKFQIDGINYFELSYNFNQQDNLLFNVFILNFREKILESKFELISKINLSEKFSSVKNFSIRKKEKERVIEIDSFNLKNIIIGNITKENEVKLFPIIFKIKFNEFQILTGNIYFLKYPDLIESIDINNKKIINFNTNIYKLIRKTNEIINFNENKDCYEFYNCYKYYLYKKDIIDTSGSGFENLANLNNTNSTNNLFTLEYNFKSKENSKIIEIVLKYILYTKYLIIIQYEKDNKLFELKTDINEKLLFHTYALENLKKFKITFYPSLKFNHDDEYINIYYKLLNNKNLYYNVIDCYKLDTNKPIMDIIIGKNYGECIKKEEDYAITSKFYDDYLKMYSYCYNDCNNCILDKDNYLIKCKELKYNKNPHITNYVYNRNFIQYFLKSDNQYFFKNSKPESCPSNYKFYFKNFYCRKKSRFNNNNSICDLGYYKKNSDCKLCENNFNMFEYDNTRYLINFDNCKNCDLNKYFDIFTGKCELNLLPNCEKEKINNTITNSILIAYYKNINNNNNSNSNLKELKDITGFNNIKNKSNNINNKLCIKCKKTYFLNSNNECDDCPENCSECIEIKYINSNIKKCTSCLDKYYLNIENNSCTLKKKSDSSCENYLFLNGINCEECIKNCKNCDGKTGCNTCRKNFIYSSSENKCILKEGCWNDKCIKCKKEYYMKDESCDKCTDKCLLCRNKNQCLLCVDYFYLYNSECIRNIGCSNNICTKCTHNYTLLKQGTCIKCIENCEFCIKENICLKCRGSLINKISSCIQKSNNLINIIDNNNFKINGKWVKKKLYYKFDNVSNKFINCLDMYLEIKINVNIILCIKNDFRIHFYNKNGTYGLNSNYFILHKKNKIFIEKIKFIRNLNYNCITSKDSLSCNKCIKGYTLDQDRNCSRGIANLCKQYITINVCKSCYKNHYIDKYNSCKNLIINNICLKYLDNRCFKCKKGYYLYGKYCFKCNTVLKNCDECSNSTHCNKCKNNYKIYLDYKENNCKLCTFPCKEILNFKINRCFEGYFWENNICKLCNLNFCITCYKDRCLTCQPGYYLLDISCYQCPDNCLKCNKDTCLQTKIHYYLELKKIKKCNNHCWICNSNLNCKKCDFHNGYYLDFKTNSCVYKNMIYKYDDNIKIKYKFFSQCKMGFYNTNGSLFCEKCSFKCKECSLYKNNCISCKDNYFLLKVIINNNLIGQCFKKCNKYQIFNLSLKKCLNCGIYNWDIYNKKELRLYYSNNLSLNDSSIVKKLIHIKTLNSKPIQFKDFKIKKSYILLNLIFTYKKRITYFKLLVKEGIFKNNWKCTEKKYDETIRGIDFKFVKKYNGIKKIKYLDKNSKEYQKINKYVKLFKKIASITSIILFIAVILDQRLSNLFSKLFNNFQIISYISIINIDFSETINTIFDIVNLNLSIIINDIINYSEEKQLKFSRKIVYNNPKIKKLDQRFFTHLDLNIVLILSSFIVRVFFIFFERFYNHFFVEKIILKKKEKYEIIRAERNINIETNYEHISSDLNFFEKINYRLKVFQLTMIMSESTNMFIFIFNYYKSFNIISFSNKYHYIIIFYMVIYIFFISYFIIVTVKIMNKLKKYDIFKIYKKKLNYWSNYFFIVGNFEQKSYHYYLWIIEFFRNSLIGFNLIYMNNHTNFQIMSLIILQVVYLIFILFLIKIDGFEMNKLKLQEFFLLYLFIKIFIIYNNKNKIFLENNYSEITGILIGLLVFNVLIVIFEILKSSYNFIYTKYKEIF